MKNGKNYSSYIGGYILFFVVAGFSSVSIQGAKKFEFDIKRALQQKNIVPVAIIGAGPAGLCAAVYTGRAKLPTYVYTGGNIGGYLNEIKQIENWPALPRKTGASVAEKLYEQAESFGVKFVHDQVNSVDLSRWPYAIETQDGQAYALSIIVATGFVPKKEDIPGVDTYWGMGVGTCTICDAPFNKDQDVIIAGGDDYAAEKALQLAAYAKKVTMIVKEPRLTATATVQDYLNSRHNIVMIFNTQITRIIGDDKQVTGAEVYDLSKKTTATLSADAVYVNSVYVPNSELVKDQVILSSEGYVSLMPGTQQTSVSGVFAAGTVADDKYRKAITACGDGGKAGMEVIDFMHNTVGFHDSEDEIQGSLFHVSADAQEAMGALKTQKELQHLIKKYRVVAVYFYRSACPYCQEIMSTINQIKTDFGDDVHVVKANAHNAEQLARDIDVNGVPYVVLYKDGVIEQRLRSVEIKNKLHASVEKLIKSK